MASRMEAWMSMFSFTASSWRLKARMLATRSLARVAASITFSRRILSRLSSGSALRVVAGGGNLLRAGSQVSHVHLGAVWPLRGNLSGLLGGFERILVPEMNMGQLVKLLRSELLVPAVGLNKVSGKPFMIAEIEAALRDRLED